MTSNKVAVHAQKSVDQRPFPLINHMSFSFSFVPFLFTNQESSLYSGRFSLEESRLKLACLKLTCLKLACLKLACLKLTCLKLARLFARFPFLGILAGDFRSLQRSKETGAGVVLAGATTRPLAQISPHTAPVLADTSAHLGLTALQSGVWLIPL